MSTKGRGDLGAYVCIGLSPKEKVIFEMTSNEFVFLRQKVFLVFLFPQQAFLYTPRGKDVSSLHNVPREFCEVPAALLVHSLSSSSKLCGVGIFISGYPSI